MHRQPGFPDQMHPGFLLRLSDFVLQTAEFQGGLARLVQAARRRRQRVERQEAGAAGLRKCEPGGLPCGAWEATSAGRGRSLQTGGGSRGGGEGVRENVWGL